MYVCCATHTVYTWQRYKLQNGKHDEMTRGYNFHFLLTTEAFKGKISNRQVTIYDAKSRKCLNKYARYSQLLVM